MVSLVLLLQIVCFQRRPPVAVSGEDEFTVIKMGNEPFSAALSNHSHIFDVVQRSLCWSEAAKKAKISVFTWPRLIMLDILLLYVMLWLQLYS